MVTEKNHDNLKISVPQSFAMPAILVPNFVSMATKSQIRPYQALRILGNSLKSVRQNKDNSHLIWIILARHTSYKNKTTYSSVQCD
jgi:hypothetical protein